MTEVRHVVCDRCKQPVLEPDDAVTLWSMKFCIRGPSPRSQLDLCKPCFAALLAWLEAPA